MDDREALLARIARLEALVAEQGAKLAERDRLIAAQAGVIAAQAAREEVRAEGQCPCEAAEARPPHRCVSQASRADAA